MRVTSFAGTCRWYRRALGRNPLVRVSDRLQALSVLAVLAVALFMMPVATHVGSQVFDAKMQTVREETQTRHSVEAEVIEGSSGIPADSASLAYVQVQWREGTQVRTGYALSAATVAAGASLSIWLDQDGELVDAPLTAVDAEVGAVGVAALVWWASVVASVLVAFVFRRGLDSARDRAWERELILLAHNDDGWANRQT